VILLEFAAQGVKGVAPAGGRATLRPGYNVVAADGPALRRLLEALLYPDPRDGEALPRAPCGPAGAPVRAGLTLVGDDRVTYRLVRDFTAGAQLHRFDADKRSFALVSQKLDEITAFLQQSVGVPSPSRLASLLALSGAELPSRAGAVGGLGGSASAVAAPQRSPLSQDQAKRRLAQLAAELEKAKVAEKLQYQLDGLQARAFKLDEALKGGQQLRDGLATAEAARAELEPVARVAARLHDPEARLAAHDRSAARRAEAVSRVSAEREALAETEARGAPPGVVWSDPLFVAGVAAGVALAVAGGVGVALGSGLRYLMLLDIPAFGWSAFVALRWIGALEVWERVVRRRRVLDDWEKKVDGQWEKDSAEVRAALAALGLAKVAELKEALGRVADADAVVAEWRRRLAEWEATPEAASAAAERARVEEAQRAIEARMADELGGFVRDVRSVETEMQRLELEAAAPAAAPPLAAPAPPPAGASASTGSLRGLLERAGRELGGSPAATGRAIAPKASQALTGLSFQRLTAIEVDDRGGVHAVTGGRSVSALTLPPADRDLVYVALKLALMEQALAAGKLVAVIDEGFPALSDGARRLVARLLKQLARPGQLVHATADAAFREAADHTA
jgi:hypothetical protein